MLSLLYIVMKSDAIEKHILPLNPQCFYFIPSLFSKKLLLCIFLLLYFCWILKIQGGGKFIYNSVSYLFILGIFHVSLVFLRERALYRFWCQFTRTHVNNYNFKIFALYIRFTVASNRILKKNQDKNKHGWLKKMFYS